MAKRISVNDLRHRITIESYDKTLNSWVQVAGAWARIYSGKPTQHTDVADPDQSVTHVITIRYNDEIRDGMRVVFGDRKMNIVSKMNYEERGRWLEMWCRE